MINRFKIFNERDKKGVLEKLNKQFGVTEIPGTLLSRGAERIFFYSGDLDRKGIVELEQTIPIERIGVYFGKFVDEKFRLSIEGVQILKDQINKNVFELDKENADLWMSGSELNVETGFKDFLIIKYGNDFLGCGKASALKIGNFVPKSRRLKIKG